MQIIKKQRAHANPMATSRRPTNLLLLPLRPERANDLLCTYVQPVQISTRCNACSEGNLFAVEVGLAVGILDLYIRSLGRFAPVHPGAARAARRFRCLSLASPWMSEVGELSVLRATASRI